MRLIDADKLVNALPKVEIDNDTRISKAGAIADFICLIADQQTIEKRKHGHWIDVCDRIGVVRSKCCSVCGNLDNIMTAISGRYCWFCGAKMDERKE